MCLLTQRDPFGNPQGCGGRLGWAACKHSKLSWIDLTWPHEVSVYGTESFPIPLTLSLRDLDLLLNLSKPCLQGARALSQTYH